MLNKVGQFIAQNNLLAKEKRYLAALSGGADSVCLLLVLKQLGYKMEAVHCNFHLRGEESDRDEGFCQELCAHHCISLHLAHFDTREYAARHKVSIEMAARELRYNYFAQLNADIGTDGICVAHHQDDSVETLLMNLFRGTGIHGLSGIRPLSCWGGSLAVIRPLLGVSRSEIEKYLGSIGQCYMTDSTNKEANVLRNKLRLQVIPRIKEIIPTATENMARTARRMREASDMFDELMERELQAIRPKGKMPCTVNIDDIKNEWLLFYLLKDYGFTSSQIEAIYQNLNAAPGTAYESKTHVLVFDRRRLLVDEIKEYPPRKMSIPEPGIYVCSDAIRLKIERFHRMEGFEIPKSPKVAVLDDETVVFPLLVRPLCAGDRFCPFGMKGSKLVSDYLTDCKRTLLDKRQQLVVEDATGKIIWLVGERPDNRCRVKENTNALLQICIL